MSPRSIPTYVAISLADLFAPFISSLSDRRRVALRASSAAFDARFENTNARMLKNNPATEARFPQFPPRKSIMRPSQDYHTAGIAMRNNRPIYRLLSSTPAVVMKYLTSMFGFSQAGTDAGDFKYSKNLLVTCAKCASWPTR